MAVVTFNHDRAKELGLDVNSYSAFPDDCYIRTWVGCVLDTYERNMRDDSDFYAIVWDEEQQQTRDVMYATTRGWTYNNGAAIDATDEVKAKAAAYWRGIQRRTAAVAARNKMAQVHVGARVRVARGRKVPRGFEGVVLNVEKIVNPYRSAPRFRSNAWDTRELVALVAGEKATHKLKVDYLEVIPDPEKIETVVQAALADFDRRWPAAHVDLSWRSMPYQNLHLAGVNIDAYR